MKNRKNARIFTVTILLIVLLSYSLNFIQISSNSEVNDYFKENKFVELPRSSTTHETGILIDESGATGKTWAEVSVESWCTGSGTKSDPYIIEDDTFQNWGSSYIKIKDSHKYYFEIKNNKFKPSGGGSSVWLDNTSRGKILDNEVEECYYGIYLTDSSNNIISGNKIEKSIYHGIFLKIADLTCEYNTISNNIIEKSIHHGILIQNSDDNYFQGNILERNEVNGIYIENCVGNTFYENTITDNKQKGIAIDDYSEGNLIYYNRFSENKKNAMDNGTDNEWDNGTIGNYWDDYEGEDADGDGIGDTEYEISGTGGGEDNYPLIESAEIFDFIAFITSPLFLLIAGAIGGLIIGILIGRHGKDNPKKQAKKGKKGRK